MIKKNLDNKLNNIGDNNINEMIQQQKKEDTTNNINVIKTDLNNTTKNPNLNPNTNTNNETSNNALGKDSTTTNNIKADDNYTFSFNKCIELRSHFDEVRKLTYLPEINALVSVSEDCLIKVWSLQNIFYNTQVNDLEPYITFRGHTGPLYCVEKDIPGTSLVY